MVSTVPKGQSGGREEREGGLARSVHAWSVPYLMVSPAAAAAALVTAIDRGSGGGGSGGGGGQLSVVSSCMVSGPVLDRGSYIYTVN